LSANPVWPERERWDWKNAIAFSGTCNFEHSIKCLYGCSSLFYTGSFRIQKRFLKTSTLNYEGSPPEARKNSFLSTFPLRGKVALTETVD
jgi:hypothetical protein